MTGFVLAGSAPYSLLSHLALYGLAAICADAGHRGLALSWTAGVNSRPRLDGESITEQTVAAAVHSHAAQRSAEGSWLYEDFNAGKQAVALMSPRIAQLDPASWPTLQQRRHGVLDRLTEHRAELDL